MELMTGREYLWHGITWATGKPALLLADTRTAALDQVNVMGLELGLKVTGPARFCTGRYGFINTHAVRPLPCPSQAAATTGTQCGNCQERDEFRFAHHLHHGGHAPPALNAYMNQPHDLYIATFAATAAKVGTAAAPRRRSRLDEQGPMHATYLTQAPDGRAVRHLEDALSRELGLAQTIRAAAKLATLPAPDPARFQAAHDAHERLRRDSTTVLTGLGVTVHPQDWSPPAEGHPLRSPDQLKDCTRYPHDLREGEHGFGVHACSGSLVLARTPAPSQHPGRAPGASYVLDLNALKGRRIVLGDYTSPMTALQSALF